MSEDRRVRPLLPLTAALLAGLTLGGCAGVPSTPEPEAAATAGPFPAVLPEQAQQVRAEVAERLLAAREAGDPALVDAAAAGLAAEVDRLGIRLAGPVADASGADPVPATVLVSPLVDGWPRWFLAVTDPAVDVPTPDPGASAEPSASGGSASAGSASVGSAPEGSVAAGDEPSAEPVPDEAGAVVAALPVLDLYVGEDVRSPFRSWARMTMLPGAEIPAFTAAEVGAPSFADGPVAGSGASGEPSGAAAEDESGEASGGASDAPGTSEADEEEAGLRAAVADLAARYASVMTDGDSSPAAAEFEPDPFVSAVLARSRAEADAVAGVASTTVVHEPYGEDEVLWAARTVDGDLLAVTAVQSTTTMTVRTGAGVLRPGPEVRAAAGIEETAGTLTTRSVAALAFVVPAEQGAIRLVAVGEDLVAAEAS